MPRVVEQRLVAVARGPGGSRAPPSCIAGCAITARHAHGGEHVEAVRLVREIIGDDPRACAAAARRAHMAERTGSQRRCPPRRPGCVEHQLVGSRASGLVSQCSWSLTSGRGTGSLRASAWAIWGHRSSALARPQRAHRHPALHEMLGTILFSVATSLTWSLMRVCRWSRRFSPTAGRSCATSTPWRGSSSPRRCRKLQQLRRLDRAGAQHHLAVDRSTSAALPVLDAGGAPAFEQRRAVTSRPGRSASRPRRSAGFRYASRAPMRQPRRVLNCRKPTPSYSRRCSRAAPVCRPARRRRRSRASAAAWGRIR